MEDRRIDLCSWTIITSCLIPAFTISLHLNKQHTLWVKYCFKYQWNSEFEDHSEPSVSGIPGSAPDFLLFLPSHLLIGRSSRRPVRTSRRSVTPVLPLSQLRQKGLCLLQFPCWATAGRNLPVLFISIVSYEFMNVCAPPKVSNFSYVK